MTSVSLPHLNATLVASATTHGFIIFGYQTVEQARAYFGGQTNPFAEIEDWLEFCLPDERSMSAIDDFHGSFHVAIPDVRDAVTFKLAWGQDILRG